MNKSHAQSCCPHQANVSLNDHLTNLQFFFLNSLDHAQNSQQMKQSHRTILESQLWLIIFLIIKCSVSFICVMHSQIIIAVWKKNRQCSVTCGSGYKIRSAICVQNNKVVNANECDAQNKPKDTYNNCQMDPCWRKVYERYAQNVTLLNVCFAITFNRIYVFCVTGLCIYQTKVTNSSFLLKEIKK